MPGAVLFLVVLLLVGGSAPAPGAAALATPTVPLSDATTLAPQPPPAATLDAWRFLPACGAATTPMALSILPDATTQPGWKQYTQPDYGLTVAVPPHGRPSGGPPPLSPSPPPPPPLILPSS